MNILCQLFYFMGEIHLEIFPKWNVILLSLDKIYKNTKDSILSLRKNEISILRHLFSVCALGCILECVMVCK